MGTTSERIDSQPASLLSAIAGFYAVLDRDDDGLAERLVTPTSQGGAGARVLQLRIKPPGGVAAPGLGALLVIARRVRAIAHRHGARFIVNDRLDLALAADADGVHLGQTDLPLGDARRLLAHLDRPFLVGVSTHDVAQVRAAMAGGADYLGFGPVFATRTKANPDAVQGLAGLAAAVAAAAGVPIVAIGGITARDAAAVYRAGAAAICAISAVNDAPHAGDTGRQFQRK